MVRDILKKMKPAQLRKYIAMHNKVVRQYIGVEIKQARAAYSERLKVKRREMKAAQTIDAKGKKKEELIELIMKEPTLVRKVKFDDENKSVDPPAPPPEKPKKKLPEIPKPRGRTINPNAPEPPKRKVKKPKILPETPQPKVKKVKVLPKTPESKVAKELKKSEPAAKPKAPTAEEIKAAAIKAAEEETDSDEEVDPPISKVPKKLHKVWIEYMEEKVGDFYSKSDQQTELDELKEGQKEYFEAKKRLREGMNLTAKETTKQRKIMLSYTDAMKNDFDDNKDFRKIYSEFASRLLKEYDDIIKEEKKRKDLDRKAKESEAAKKVKFEEALALKKQKANEEEEKRIAKFEESEKKRKEEAKKTKGKEIKSKSSKN